MSRLNYVETGKAYTACMKDTPHVPLRQIAVGKVVFFSSFERSKKNFRHQHRVRKELRGRSNTRFALNCVAEVTIIGKPVAIFCGVDLPLAQTWTQNKAHTQTHTATPHRRSVSASTPPDTGFGSYGAVRAETIHSIKGRTIVV